MGVITKKWNEQSSKLLNHLMKLRYTGKVSVEFIGGKWAVFAEGKKHFSSSDKIEAIEYARSVAPSNRIVIYGRHGQTFHSAPGKGKLSGATISTLAENMSPAVHRSSPRRSLTKHPNRAAPVRH
jgi:hypothetical protein